MTLSQTQSGQRRDVTLPQTQSGQRRPVTLCQTQSGQRRDIRADTEVGPPQSLRANSHSGDTSIGSNLANPSGPAPIYEKFQVMK